MAFATCPAPPIVARFVAKRSLAKVAKSTALMSARPGVTGSFLRDGEDKQCLTSNFRPAGAATRPSKAGSEGRGQCPSPRTQSRRWGKSEAGKLPECKQRIL